MGVKKVRRKFERKIDLNCMDNTGFPYLCASKILKGGIKLC